MAKTPGVRFDPTPAQRGRVAELVFAGLTEAQIASLLPNPATGKPITEKTLRKHFKRELATGTCELVSSIAKNLNVIAMGSGSEAVSAAKFILQCRGNWKPSQTVEHSAPGGGPIGFYNASELSKLSEPELDALAAAITKLTPQVPV